MSWKDFYFNPNLNSKNLNSNLIFKDVQRSRLCSCFPFPLERGKNSPSCSLTFNWQQLSFAVVMWEHSDCHWLSFEWEECQNTSFDFYLELFLRHLVWVMFCHQKDNHSWAVTVLKHTLFFSWMSKECQATNQMSFVECTKQLTTTTPEPTWTAGQRFENFAFVQLFSCKNYHIFCDQKAVRSIKKAS